MLQAVPSNNIFNSKDSIGLTTSNHLNSPDDRAKDEDAIVEALSSMVVAASNRTQEDSAWDTAGYSRSTSKFNTTRNCEMMQATPDPVDICLITTAPTVKSPRLAGGF